MKNVLLVLLLLTPSIAMADYWFVEIGAGFNDWSNVEQWSRNNKIGALINGGYVWELEDNNAVVLELGHLSQYNEGPPFNENSEPYVNYAHIKYRWEWH